MRAVSTGVVFDRYDSVLVVVVLDDMPADETNVVRNALTLFVPAAAPFGSPTSESGEVVSEKHLMANNAGLRSDALATIAAS
jgi:hypothetical protein